LWCTYQQIGDYYYEGRAGLPQDPELAVKNYMAGMHKRHPKAYYSMGYMHATGKGVPQDLLLARKAYQDAASLSSEVSDLKSTNTIVIYV
jgi:TPR repeat protein